MGDASPALRGAVLLAAFGVTGFAAARATVRRVDAFAVAWWALAVTSVAGVALARIDRFSLPALVGIDATVAALALLVGRRYTPGERVVPAAVGVAALLAALGAAAWAWPPFETFFAGADSTMYLDAGVHLARTGSFTVPDTVARLLPDDVAKALFPSVGLLDRGPFIRLPGGLLMDGLHAVRSTPAFFPLLPVWSAVLAAVGGPAWVPAVAPLAMALAVAAVVLFAGERFGLATAVAAAVLVVANFAVWWFARFAMSEPLTIAFVWGGLVFLGRREPFAAGVMLGLAALARTETLVFAVGAVAWWATWTRVARGEAFPVLAGLLAGSCLAAIGLLTAPSHHLGYLANDFAYARLRVAAQMLVPWSDGRLPAALVLVAAMPVAAAVVATWRGRAGLGANVLRATIAVTTVVAIACYLRIGGSSDVPRSLRWLVGFMSSPLLMLAVAGAPIMWTRGGNAGRLACLLVLLTAAVFVPKPGIAGYQPWAMRRFLPIVVPGLTIAAAIVVGRLLSDRRRLLQVVAVVAMLGIAALEISPVLAARRYDYFGGTLAASRRVADAIPADAVAVVDSGFADLQLQVPLWLVYGRESVMVSGGRPVWRALLSTLLGAGRRVYWVQNAWAPPPTAPGLVFTAVPGDTDVSVVLPDAPADVPPAFGARKLAPLRVYGVAVGVGMSSGGGVGMVFSFAGSS